MEIHSVINYPATRRKLILYIPTIVGVIISCALLLSEVI